MKDALEMKTAKLKKYVKHLYADREANEKELIDSIMRSSTESMSQNPNDKMYSPPPLMRDVFPSLRHLNHKSPSGPKLNIKMD